VRTSPYVPSIVSRELRRIGEGIQTARLRRNMSQQELADRLGVSIHTVRAVEAGKAGTGVGTYLHALWVLDLIETVSQVADPALDEVGKALEASDRRRRSSPTTGRLDDAF
jgi:transcriptional regulator with XRE-family HTH domain